MQRNHIPLHTQITRGGCTYLACHFSLHEFEMKEGTVHTLGFHYVSNTLGSASITSK